MGLSIYPTPSASASSTPIGAGPVVAVGTETKGWYKTTLAAGSYYIYAYTNNDSIAVNAYNNNIYSSYISGISSRPYKLTLTTSDTVYLSTSWVYESNYANTDGNPFGSAQMYAPDQRDYNQNPWSHWWESDGGKGCFTQYSYGETQAVFTAYDVSAGIPLFKNFTGGIGQGANTTYPAYNSYVNNAYFVLTRSSSPRILRSTNGTSWTNIAVTGVGPAYNFIYYGGGMYVALCEGGSTNALVSSTDGITWATRATTGSGNLIHGTYGAGKHVVGGQSGYIATSTDGYTWTSRTSGLSNDVGVIKYNSTLGQFIACCRAGSHSSTTPMMARSTDGITWTTMNPQPLKKGIDLGGYYGGWIYGFTYGYDNGDSPTYPNSLMVYNGEWYLNSGWAGSLFSTDGISWGYGVGPGQRMDIINGKLVNKNVTSMRNFYYSTPSPLGYAIYQA